MKSLIQPEGVTEKELETYVAGLQENAQKDVKSLRGSGAGEAEIVEYIASLGSEPEDTIGPPDGQPPVRTERISSRRRSKLREESLGAPPGVQGANTGYWQAGGATRAGAKRSKRP